jgi:hypothetical protein
LLTACGSKAEVISGTPEELLPALVAEARATLPEYGLGDTFDEAVTADSAEFALGLTAAQFTANVDSAFQAKAMMMTTPQTAILVKAKDAAAAAEVARLIAAGFDSTQWICVMPERSVVVTAGSWVLLAVGSVDSTNALVEAFGKLAEGSAGEPNTFYFGPTE